MRKYRISLENFIDEPSFCVYRKEPWLQGILKGWVYVSSWKTLEQAKEAITQDRKNPIHEE